MSLIDFTLWLEGVLEPFEVIEHLLRLLCIVFPAFSEFKLRIGLRLTRSKYLPGVSQTEIHLKPIWFRQFTVSECYLINRIEELVAAQECLQRLSSQTRVMHESSQAFFWLC